MRCGKGRTYANEGNVVAVFGPQTDRENEVHFGVVDNGPREYSEARVLGLDLAHLLWLGRSLKSSASINGLGHPDAVSQNVCMKSCHLEALERVCEEQMRVVCGRVQVEALPRATLPYCR